MEDKPSESLTDELAAQITSVASTLEAAFVRHLKKLGSTPTLKRSTLDAIAKRVPRNSIAQCSTPEGAASLLALEIEYIGLRISRYQFIERYREHFTAPNCEMGAAFIAHIHTMRGSEIYIIMERSTAFLDFLAHYTNDLGLLSARRARALEKTFKTVYERHLRERHRIVHAHEKSSLASRVLDAPVGSREIPAYGESILQIGAALTQSLLDVAPHMAADDAETFMHNVNEHRLKVVDDECRTMWSTLVGHITETVNHAKLLK